MSIVFNGEKLALLAMVKHSKRREVRKTRSIIIHGHRQLQFR